MFSEYELGVVYRDDCENDSYKYGEWYDADEETLRTEIAEVLNKLEVWERSIDEEVVEAYKKMLKNGEYNLPHCTFCIKEE